MFLSWSSPLVEVRSSDFELRTSNFELRTSIFGLRTSTRNNFCVDLPLLGNSGELAWFSHTAVGVIIIRGGQPRTSSGSQVHVLFHQYQSELGRTSSAENSGVASPQALLSTPGPASNPSLRGVPHISRNCKPGFLDLFSRLQLFELFLEILLPFN